MEPSAERMRRIAAISQGDMPLGKVVCYITRTSEGQEHLLLLRHPYAGNQIPAGTVETGESFEAGALREAREETGLAALSVVGELKVDREELPPGAALIQVSSTVYSRPDFGSFDWVTIPRGVRVDTGESKEGFVRIRYCEPEALGSHRVSYEIAGWMEKGALTTTVERRHYRLRSTGGDEGEWEVFSDHHRFVLMWHPLSDEPRLEEPFRQWFESVRKDLEE